MSKEFYKFVLEEEQKTFDVNETCLKRGIKNVSKAYNEESLKSGNTFINYNLPENRCAYLFKFAALHTDLVKKYFSEFLKKKAKKLLNSKKHIRICCLGGGPGTDIIGIFKALAVYPQFHKKVIKVVILDICRGWSNSFKIILSKVMKGKMEDISAEFIDASKFEAELIEVNLLEALPTNVMEAISTADILCSVKFISAILENPTSINAMKLIAGALKVGTLFLFVDNMKRHVYKLVEKISTPTGLKVIFGPLHENFAYRLVKRSRVHKSSAGTAVSVIGMLKTEINLNSCVNQIVEDITSNNISDNDSWSTESDVSVNDAAEHINTLSDEEKKPLDFILKVNQFTQTCVPGNFNSNKLAVVPEKNLDSLIEALDKLLISYSKFSQSSIKRQCCYCHCLKNGF